MFSYTSIENSKIHILKITIILLIAHIYKCYSYSNIKCGNINWSVNTFGLICGILIYNLFWFRIAKNIHIKNKKTYNLCKNMLMYTFSLITQYFIISYFYENYPLSVNKYIIILSILFIFNLISNLLDDEKLYNSYKNLNKKRFILNSLNTTLFIILIDLYIYMMI